MKADPALDTPFTILEEPKACGECHAISRLSNGLCLNCLLRGALDEEAMPSGREAFKEALAAVKSQDGDWHIGEHEILDEIARGGMGVIYRAREPHSGRIVALKCILAYHGDSDQAVARFRREAETVARLDHPNIVPIYHVGETADGAPFFTMKYAPNGSLLQARGPLREQPRQSVMLMAKVAQAVQCAHEQGVLHRDLKPGNVLLDGRGEPLVSDFGLARCDEIAGHLTRSLASLGTPGYIAPEQADGPAARLTPAADVYSLGAILFELFTGRPPFVGDNALNVMKQAAEKPAPKLRTLAPHLDRDLETICARCLDRDPSARYQSAGSLAQDLLNWLGDRPIIARPVGRWLRSRRWVRSNRKLAAVAAAFLVLAIVSVGWRIRTQQLESSMYESLLASRSVVVLPFLDLDNVAVDPSLAQSFADSLQTELNLLGPARVKAMEPGSPLEGVWTQEPRQIAQRTGARTILTGTVRTVQDRKRFSIRLLDAATGDSLFTRLTDENGDKNPFGGTVKQMAAIVFPILSANDWSGIVQSKMDPGLRNEVAKEAILAGREVVRSDTTAHVDKAIALFMKALRAEPDSALAHAYLAMAATGRIHFNPDRSFLEVGKREAERALQLAPGLADAHRALAGVYYQEGKFSEAFEQALQTVEIGGVQNRLAMFLGMTLDMLGRPDQALPWQEVASHLATKPGEAEASIGDCWVKLGGDEQAEQAYNRATELRPNSSNGIVGMARLRMLQGNFEAAREICRSLPVAGGESAEIAAQIEFFERRFDVAWELFRNLHKANPYGGGSSYGAMTYCSAAGRAKQALGELGEAKRILEDCLIRERANAEREPGNPEAHYRLAAVEASLGMTEAALSHLQQSAILGWVDYRSLNLDPRFDSLRGNPAFEAIIQDLTIKVADMRSRMKWIN